MTLAQATAARDALYTQYMAWIEAGCPQAYSINGRAKTNCTANFWLEQIGQLEGIISRQSTGGCPVASFRTPD